ncbi:hypothetical protein CTAYLR_004253 [Chrysophaeum taylorii]|uniref:protein-serine/threonine phosphatase n=1 Tax=Chrysophaeum taylorii TaxID=2483200 RepID=A0AAD7UE56_9STRA|nr:hypothetical protein CTAYLR_004253 [Chrysophaeum taylorii]
MYGEDGLRRAAGSKGSLHSLLVGEEAAAPVATQSTDEGLWHCARNEPMTGASLDRLSQSYSQPRTPLAIQERLAAADSEMRGELEWLDLRSYEWRRCYCVLRAGVVRCFAPDGDVDARRAVEDADSEADEEDDLELEELALSMGARGRSVVRLSLTRVALVATDPRRGPRAFRLVLERDGVESDRSFRANDRNEWLFGFHKSLAIVVARIRGEKQQTNSRRRCGIVRKKSSSRRSRVAEPGTLERANSATRVDMREQDFGAGDEGAAIFRKSSARPRIRGHHRSDAASSAKYVPPHRRRAPEQQQQQQEDAPPKEEEDVVVPAPRDGFEETGDESTSSSSPPPPPPRLVLAKEEAAEVACWRRKVAPGKNKNGAARGLALEWRSGAVCEQGKRRRNEDRCVDLSALTETPESTFGYFGVYDGHSGDDAVERCANDLHARVSVSLREGNSVASALEEAFALVDAEYCADAARGEASLDAGATALSCVLRVDGERAPPSLVVANCGDCFGVLSRNGVAAPLSTPHAPAPGSSEAKRVLSAGGWITTETDLCVGRLHAMDLDDPEIGERAHERVRLNEIHRVCGEVAVTRAIGDVDFKGWGPACPPKPAPAFAYPENHNRRFTADLLVATPEIVAHDLDANDEFVLLATDGLWDVVEPQEAVAVAAGLFNQQRTPRAVAKHLVDRALRLGSGDNVTVLALQFNWVDLDRPRVE